MLTSHTGPLGTRRSFSRSSLKRSRTFSSLLFRARSSLRRPECASHAYRACAWNTSTGSVPGDGVAPPDPRPDPTTPRGDVPPEAHAFAPVAAARFKPVGVDPPTLVAANERASISAGAAHSHKSEADAPRRCARAETGLEDCRDDDGELAVVDGHRECVSLSDASRDE
jgi:hypothetical protein